MASTADRCRRDRACGRLPSISHRIGSVNTVRQRTGGALPGYAGLNVGVGVGRAGVAVAVGMGEGVGVGGTGVAVGCAGGPGEALAGVGVDSSAVATGATGVNATGGPNAGVAVGVALGAPAGAGWPDCGVRKWDDANQLSARMTMSARLAQKRLTPGSALGSALVVLSCGMSCAAPCAGSGAESGRLMCASLQMSRTSEPDASG